MYCQGTTVNSIVAANNALVLSPIDFVDLHYAATMRFDSCYLTVPISHGSIAIRRQSGHCNFFLLRQRESTMYYGFSIFGQSSECNVRLYKRQFYGHLKHGLDKGIYFPYEIGFKEEGRCRTNALSRIQRLGLRGRNSSMARIGDCIESIKFP